MISLLVDEEGSLVCVGFVVERNSEAFVVPAKLFVVARVANKLNVDCTSFTVEL